MRRRERESLGPHLGHQDGLLEVRLVKDGPALGGGIVWQGRRDRGRDGDRGRGRGRGRGGADSVVEMVPHQGPEVQAGLQIAQRGGGVLEDGLGKDEVVPHEDDVQLDVIVEEKDPLGIL